MALVEGLAIILILLFSVVIHEVSHGWAAFALGDPTAKNAGRLTLNPIKHLDLFGSIILPLTLILLSKLSGGAGIIFGWAKPVPVNPYNFRDRRYGQAKVAIAGPLANIILAIVFGLMLRFFWTSFNGLSIMLLGYIVWINLILAIFNLIPVPPLDGSHILFAFMPNISVRTKLFLSQYGMVIVLILFFFFFSIIFDITNFFFKILTAHPILL